MALSALKAQITSSTAAPVPRGVYGCGLDGARRTSSPSRDPMRAVLFLWADVAAYTSSATDHDADRYTYGWLHQFGLIE